MARDVVGRGALDRDERAGEEPDGGEREQRVQPQVELARDERRGRLGGGLDGRRVAHRVAELPALNLSLPRSNQFERISRAAGAAVSAPKPPFSTVTTTTIGRWGSLTKQAYQAWSGFGPRSAVPVLPYIV